MRTKAAVLCANCCWDVLLCTDQLGRLKPRALERLEEADIPGVRRLTGGQASLASHPEGREAVPQSDTAEAVSAESSEPEAAAAGAVTEAASESAGGGAKGEVGRGDLEGQIEEWEESGSEGEEEEEKEVGADDIEEEDEESGEEESEEEDEDYEKELEKEAMKEGWGGGSGRAGVRGPEVDSEGWQIVPSEVLAPLSLPALPQKRPAGAGGSQEGAKKKRRRQMVQIADEDESEDLGGRASQEGGAEVGGAAGGCGVVEQSALGDAAGGATSGPLSFPRSGLQASSAREELLGVLSTYRKLFLLLKKRRNNDPLTNADLDGLPMKLKNAVLDWVPTHRPDLGVMKMMSAFGLGLHQGRGADVIGTVPGLEVGDTFQNRAVSFARAL